MKNSAWYNKLWQTKMQELPLQGDEHDAWQKMQSLLDHHMPVNSAIVAPKAATSVWVKLMYVLAAIICAAILYYAASRMPAHQHEKTNKPTAKHAQINTDSTTHKNNLPPTGAPTDSAVYNRGNNADSTVSKHSGIQNALSSSVTTDKSLPTNKTNIGTAANANKADAKHITNNTPISNTKSSGIDNRVAGDSRVRRNKIVGHLAAGGNSGVLKNSKPGLYHPGLQRRAGQNHSANNLYSKAVKENNATSKNDAQLFEDQNSVKTNSVLPSNTGNDTTGDGTNGTTKNINPANLSSKTDASTTTKNTTAQQIADAKIKNQSNKSGAKSKASAAKKAINSKFTVDIKLGDNTNKGSILNPFLGIIGNYGFHSKWDISIGANILSTKIISGSYSKSNLNYITIGDSSKKITHNSGRLTINSTKKIYYVDIPMLVTYKLSDKFTIKAGPVISIPIKTEANKNTLGPLSSSADTTTLRTVVPYVNSTTINSKINFSFSAGAQYSVKRFYFDAAYLQGLSPYTVGSGLGSGKIYYRTIQIGIGYHLFKPK